MSGHYYGRVHPYGRGRPLNQQQQQSNSSIPGLEQHYSQHCDRSNRRNIYRQQHYDRKPDYKGNNVPLFTIDRMAGTEDSSLKCPASSNNNFVTFIPTSGRITHEYLMFVRNMCLAVTSHVFEKSVADTLKPYGDVQVSVNRSHTSCKILLRNDPQSQDFAPIYERGDLELQNFPVTMFKDVSRKLFQTEEVDWKKLQGSVTLAGDFYEQTKLIKSIGLMSDSCIESRRKLCLFLECLLNFGEFHCNSLPFGSTVTGLGFKDTDLDMFMDMKDQDNKNSRMERKEAVTLLYSVWKFLRTQLNMYIPKPIDCRHPIIKIDFSKCPRNPRGVTVDISVACILGVYNSRLIEFICRVEPLFKDLAAVIKYWMKTQGMIGPSNITSYGCLLMVMFYLQSILVLPSIYELQFQVQPEFIESKWNVAFNPEDTSCFPYTRDGLIRPKLSSLFLGFFNFYAKFSFENQAICPFVGRPMSKSDLAFRYSIRSTSLTIQDFIQLDSNVGQNVLQNFFDCFRVIIKFINHEIVQLDTIDDDLVAKKIYTKMVEELDSDKLKAFSRNKTISQDEGKPYLTLKPLPFNVTQKLIMKWAKTSVEIIERTLKEVLLFTSFTRNDFVDLSDTNKIPCRQCYLTKFMVKLREKDHAVWMKRTELKYKQENPTLVVKHKLKQISDYIEKEMSLTKDILKQKEQENKEKKEREETEGEDVNDVQVLSADETSLNDVVSNTVLVGPKEMTVSFQVLINSAVDAQLIELDFDEDEHVSNEEKIWYRKVKTFLSDYLLEHVEYYFVRDQLAN